MTDTWQAATQYFQGTTVVAKTQNVVGQELPTNNSFETSGLANWTVTGIHCTNAAAIAATSVVTAQAYDGSYSVTMSNIAGDGTGPNAPNGNHAAFARITNNLKVAVTPGQVINFKARAWVNPVDNTQAYCNPNCGITWYNSSSAVIGTTSATAVVTQPWLTWYTISGKGTAPAGAAYASAWVQLTTTSYASQHSYVDDYTWDYTTQVSTNGLAYVATQTAPGVSGASEPVWPTIPGNTVVDGTVTWTAESVSTVTWTAQSILITGATEPTWPTVIGGTVPDGRIEWTATDGRITDANCPSYSTVVQIGSAKVFAADADIVRFCATANPLDWTSSQDAGFLPFGLQTFGSEPIAGLGLYRSNLVIFNALGYQMWQIDPDPNNMAILDAEPVGCTYPKSIQPVNNDLVFLSPVGVRNIGTAGAAGNLQAGQFGKMVDPIVKYLISQLSVTGYEVKSVFVPGTGQYWVMFGPQAIVLTINGNNTMSWSRYVFPASIDNFATENGVLYLRAGDLVWRFDEGAYLDDEQLNTATGGANTGFQGYMSWNYLDCGPVGLDKQMEGFDLVVGTPSDYGQVVPNNITVNVSFGYNQAAPAQATVPFAVIGDTMPGTMTPMPVTAPSIQLRLDFGTGQNWGWSSAALYVKPVRAT